MRASLILALALSWGGSVFAGDYNTTRLVTLGGALTETVFALGAGDQVVGVDASSEYPPAVKDLPHAAYHRRLAAEGVLSLAPTLVIATTEAGPPAALDQLRSAGVPVVLLEEEHSLAGAKDKIRRLAALLGRQEKGEELVRQIDLDLQALSPTIAAGARVPVLFLYARGQGTLMVSGQGTNAQAMIALVGGANAVQGYEGYKPLTAEAALAAAPQVILLMDSGLESVGGVEGALALPGLALTPAGQQRRVVSMDGLFLLGFGPRMGQAALALHRVLYPQASESAAHGQ